MLSIRELENVPAISAGRCASNVPLTCLISTLIALALAVVPRWFLAAVRLGRTILPIYVASAVPRQCFCLCSRAGIASCPL